MIYLVLTVHVVISIFLILVVLLQQGKGADLSVFGGGGSQAAFGARGAATVLHKLTVICFVLFIVTTLSIGILRSRSAPSVMGGVESDATSDSAPAPTAPAGGQLPAAEETQPEPGAEDGTSPEANQPNATGPSGAAADGSTPNGSTGTPPPAASSSQPGP